jgi:orotate phosphoribosyltransferase
MELDQLFTHPAALQPFVIELGNRIARHGIEAVYGPLTGGAFLAYAIADHLAVDFGFLERIPSERPGLFPVDYRLAPALRAAATGRRVALVDDAISAGSAVQAALADLTSCGAIRVALGALITIGPRAAALAAEEHLPLESLIELPAAVYAPTQCPLCALGAPLTDP